MKSNHVLVILDPKQSEHPALARVADVARSGSVSVELYSCDWEARVPARWIGSLTLAQYQALMREERGRWLEQLALPLRAQGLDVVTHSDWHPSVEQAVLNHIVATKPTMVIDDELYQISARSEAVRA